jgi:hypothetical protein
LGDPEVVLRAVRKLDIETSALRPAETAELLAIGKRVQFRHPLVRSAVYRAAPPATRQHKARNQNPTRTATWHLLRTVVNVLVPDALCGCALRT